MSNVSKDNDDNLSSPESLTYQDISDTDDPTYVPGKEKSRKIPDYFSFNNIKSKPLALTETMSESETNIANNGYLGSASCSSSSVSSFGDKEDSENQKIHSLGAYLDGKYFKVLCLKEKNIKSQCQICLPKIHYTNGIKGVSTNFLKHIKRVHPTVLEEFHLYISEHKKYKGKRKTDELVNFRQPLKIQKQQTINSCFSNSARQTISQNEFENRLLKFTISSMSAISVLGNPEFIKIFEGLNLTVLSRRTAMRRISDLNEKCINSIQNQLSDTDFVCTTADIWSAKKRSFLGITCHWVDMDLCRHSVALACKRFSGTHSYDRIAEHLEEVHSAFNLNEHKIVATITDNGSNFVKAFREFGINLSENIVENSLEPNGNTFLNEEDESQNSDSEEEIESPIFPTINSADKEIASTSNDSQNICIQLPKHKRCASHTINLIAVTDVNKSINSNPILRKRHTNIMSKCSVLWNKCSYPKSAEIIKDTLGHYLSYPCITRWNSYYDAITQILNEKEKLNDLFAKLNVKDSFKDNEIKYLEEYCKILNPLALAIDILQGEKNTFYGYLLPCIATALVKLYKLKEERLSLTETILDACIQGLERRFSNLIDLNDEANDAIIAAFTIPKFKFRWYNTLKDRSVRDLTALQK